MRSVLLIVLVLVSSLSAASAEKTMPAPEFYYLVGTDSGKWLVLSTDGVKSDEMRFSEASAWRVVPLKGGVCRLLNAKAGPGRCLGVVNGRLAMGPVSDDASMTWTVRLYDPSVSDKFIVTNTASHQVLHLPQAGQDRPTVGPLADDESYLSELRFFKYRRVDSPLPDYAGNLYLNELDGQKEGPNRGGLWRVVGAVLEVRAKPDATSAIVHRYHRGDVIEADIGRGGAEEVKNNTVDGATGNTWMPVRHGRIGRYDWYVRASKKTLRPVMGR